MIEEAILGSKEGIVKLALGSNVTRPQSSGRCFDHSVDYQTVRKSFPRKQDRFGGIRIFACKTNQVERSWYKPDFSRRDVPAEGLIKSMEGRCPPEIGHIVGIHDHQTYRGSHNCNRWQPIFSTRETFRKELGYSPGHSEYSLAVV